ncbi:MAG TPA: hypothetical protein VKS21_13710, partial [Spirochaetota bacterium]|nr:hypothetical protein [Spirochaetota bacterium]
LEILAAVESNYKEVRNIERKIKRYWFLCYLKKYCLTETFKATVIGRIGAAVNIELDHFYLRSAMDPLRSYKQGEKVQVRLLKIIPRKNYIRFQEIDNNK